MRGFMFGAALLAAVATSAEASQPPVVLHVSETAGIRRTMYPVNARVPFPKGHLPDAAHARLLLNGTEVAAQLLSESRWPDGSVQWLDVDFNVSIGPLETANYSVEYGPDIVARALPRGLTVMNGPDRIQVGNIAFGKRGAPLILSAKYRDENIGQGANGVSVVDAAGRSHDLALDAASSVQIVKPGPLDVVLRWQGQLSLDAGQLPFDVSVEMPNSKSWVKISAAVGDPARRLRELVVSTPIDLGSFPWLWDFGTPNWTYGVLRAAGDRAALTETTTAQGRSDWHVDLAAGGRPPEPVEAGTSRNHAVRWGHIQGASHAIAFAIESVADEPATSSVIVDGTGQLTVRMSPTQPAREQRLTVYEHFVTTPVQVGAATSPAAILAPLVTVCDRRQYVSSGVPAPRNAR